jgi:hypothetical protein
MTLSCPTGLLGLFIYEKCIKSVYLDSVLACGLLVQFTGYYFPFKLHELSSRPQGIRRKYSLSE